MPEAQALKLDEEQLRRYIPKSAQRRMALLEEIVGVLDRKRWKNGLDETNPDDLRNVVSIVSDLHPEATTRKAAEYAQVAIRLWKKRKRGPE